MGRTKSDAKGYMKWTALAVAGSTVLAALQFVYNIFPVDQLWIRVALAAIWPLSVLAAAFVLCLVRAPWNLHNEANAEIAKLEDQVRDGMRDIKEGQQKANEG